jgi:lysyl-tRNA synthetase class 1
MTEIKHWADAIAEKLISLNPKKKKFICAAGISPSGTVHIGNFRDVITVDLVCRALKDKGYQAEKIFSWDEFDRLRKIPSNIPSNFSKYFGMPLVEIPDFDKCHKSYAEHFEKPFEEVLPELGIKIRFIHQSEMYGKNKYYEGIKTALKKRKEIAKILAGFKTQGMTKEGMENYYPLQIYCRKCRSSLNTKITKYDGENKIEYSCKCGHKEKIDISKENVGKLDWKVDWAMRWKYEEVSFEPGGEDHASPGGSYDVSSVIAREIYGINPPLFQGYGFVGVQGAFKMSSSKGTGISPKDLLEIYEPELLRWIFVRDNPKKSITFFFDSEIIRQYDEFDEKIINYSKLSEEEKREIDFAKIDKKPMQKTRVPFRQVASFGQISQGNFSELKNMFKEIKEKYNEEMLKIRLEKSQNWVEKFVPEMKIKVRETPNANYFKKLSKEEKEQVNKLKKKIKNNWTMKKLTVLVYEIPKKPNMSEEDKKSAQRNFFKNIYQILIDKDTGPRLPTFLLALGDKRVEKLLSVK